MDQIKILVIDDEENIRFLYKEELTDSGYKVDCAANAEEAERKIAAFKPDVITLDIKMPGMDGIEFLRKFRGTNPDTPVILCTAFSDYKQDFRVWASDDYIVKSSDFNELKTAIERVIAKKNEQTQS